MPALGEFEARPIMLGRYEIVAPIGRGGMAEVHLAVQRGPAGFEKLVVIKVVHEHLASEATFVEMLRDEARHAALIKHPNVVDVYELGEEAGRYFIAMEYLDGEPLLEVLRVAGEGARLDPMSTARVIADTAEGLDAAHRLKSRDGKPLELVHHDVSLGNIVVLYSGLVKLVDFGVAKAPSASSGARVQGKVGYMAPEKVTDRAVDRRSDIWSLGCVLWEALTLKRLFKGETDLDTARQVIEAEIPPPSTVEPGLPPELDRIALRALERDPARRYQTAKALAADLEEVLREHGYGAKNDRIAQHMEAAFAARIEARERVLMEVSSKRRPSAATLEAAFGQASAPATRTISLTGEGPLAEVEDEDETEAEAEIETEDKESAHESTTMKTPPNPPDWKPAPATPPTNPPATPPAKPPAAPRPAEPDAAGAAAGKGGGVISPSAFSQPRPRQTGTSEAPQLFSVASLLDQPAAATPPAATPAEPMPPLTPAPQAPVAEAPVAEAPEPEWSPPTMPTTPMRPLDVPPPTPAEPTPPLTPAPPVLPAPPILPARLPERPGEPNPFAEDDDFKTVADVIPANAEASRSLQSEPSWRVARQSAALGELQRWVQDSRSQPKSRWEALKRWVQPWHHRVVVWAIKRKLPRLTGYAILGGVLLVAIVLTIAMCAGGSSKDAAKSAPKPAIERGSETDADGAKPAKQR